MAYIEGVDRCQPCFSNFFILDDLIAEDNPVRVIDAYVDSLDLPKLGFILYDPSKPGQRPYATSTLLKIQLYSFFNHINSSRKQEKETHRNIELMWLVNSITPDHSTISTFFANNADSIKSLFRDFNKLCVSLNLFGFKLFAIDGTKIKASNSIKNSFTQKKLQDALEHIEAKITEYESGINSDLSSDDDISEFKEKLELVSKRKIKYNDILDNMKQQNLSEINLIDPDCKVMNNHGKSEPCYNIQTVVDSKNHLIMDMDVNNNANDIGLFKPMVEKVVEDYDLAPIIDNTASDITAIADAGYFKTSDITYVNDIGINPIVPKPSTSNATNDSNFSKDKFIYSADDDTYICPKSKKLRFIRSSKETRKNIINYYKIYFCSDCSTCPDSSKCTTSINGRSIKRNVNESTIQKIQLEFKATSKLYRIRKALVEHPFGTIKFSFGNYFTYYRTKQKVSAWTACALLSYNWTRVINILGVKGLIQAINAR